MRTGYIDRLIDEDRGRRINQGRSFFSGFLQQPRGMDGERLLPVFSHDDGSPVISDRAWIRRKEAIISFIQTYWRIILMAVIVIIVFLEIIE